MLFTMYAIKPNCSFEGAGGEFTHRYRCYYEPIISEVLPKGS